MKKATFRMLAYSAAAVLAVAATLAGPTLVARLATPSTGLERLGKAESMPPADSLPFVLVVGARPERMAEDDPIPHRNSQVALYQRSEKGAGWTLVEGPLAMRASSTARFTPAIRTVD